MSSQSIVADNSPLKTLLDLFSHRGLSELPVCQLGFYMGDFSGQGRFQVILG